MRDQRDDPKVAAQAVEALARLMVRKNLMEHAVFYYSQLGRDFAQVEIKDGKTGADFYNELTTDKRLLPFLGEGQQQWKGRVKQPPEEKVGQNPVQPAFTYLAEGELLPFFQKHRLALEQNSSQLKVINRSTGDVVWQTDALWRNPNFNLISQFLFNGNAAQARHAYQVKGHVVIFNLGHMVYGLDPVDHKKLWEFNLYSQKNAPLPPQTRIVPDGGGWQLIYPDGMAQKIGQTGAVEVSEETSERFSDRMFTASAATSSWKPDPANPVPADVARARISNDCETRGDGRRTRRSLSVWLASAQSASVRRTPTHMSSGSARRSLHSLAHALADNSRTSPTFAALPSTGCAR